MSSKNKSNGFPNIGLSSFLIVFLILCLTTFALLALSTAKSDDTLSKKLADHRTDYYAASSQAEEILAQIDAILEQKQNQSLAGTDFSNIDNTSISINTEENLDVLSYSVPMKNDRILSVKLQITDPEESEHYYKILEWKVSEK